MAMVTALFQVPLFQASPFVGYVYPNETIIPWSELIVIYPYLTGLVAGAFIVSSFYHVFGMQQFKPVARFALLTALAFMICVPAPLLLHLGHPERAFEAMITPHWSSAFAAFSYVASFYVVVLMLETWFAFRADFVASAGHNRGLRKLFYRILALDSDDVSERALGYDRRWARALAMIGIPAATLLHGYVGFVFGSLKSRQWWSSDLMPVIFLLSAVVSGIGLLIVLYIATSRIRRTPADETCLRALAQALWSFLIVVVVVEGLEYLTMFYRSEEGIQMIEALIRGPIRAGLTIQAAGSAIALILLTWLIVFRERGKTLVRGLAVAAVVVLIEVFAMRWNVVIGGQELSKTMRGLLVYAPPVLGRDGLVAAAGLLTVPFLLLWLFVRLFPPWEPAHRDAHVPRG
ncbi:MAG: polysulfide reductase NrfD [Alphaproteobacteria bacterium]|nr:polysulfide reductase NrfD [Alphaproteobacteria bacterium]